MKHFGFIDVFSTVWSEVDLSFSEYLYPKLFENSNESDKNVFCIILVKDDSQDSRILRCYPKAHKFARSVMDITLLNVSTDANIP